MSWFRTKYKIIIGIILFLFVLMAFTVRQTYRNVNCRDIKIIITNTYGPNFLDTNEIITFLSKNIDFKIIGNKFKKINLYQVEQSLQKIPYIKKSNVYRDKNNILCVEIEEYRPISRIYDQKGNSFYISIEGQILPIRNSVSFYVPVINGNIQPLNVNPNQKISLNDKHFQNTIYDQIYFISKKSFNNSYAYTLIDQIYVANNNEFIIIPKIGDFIIKLGDTSNFDAKIEKLRAFYQIALPRVGWNKYKEINLKYKNQIVCVKK